MWSPDSRRQFRRGVVTSIPRCLGYLTISLAFGLLARMNHMPAWQAVALSMIVYAGASQFVAVNMMAAQATALQIVLTGAILNFRLFMMSATLTRLLDMKMPRWALALLGAAVTDEAFAVLACEEPPVPRSFAAGLMIPLWLSWWGGTLLGCLVASALPQALQKAMGIALYSMFIALVVPGLKARRSMIFVAFVAVAVNWGWTLVPTLERWGAGLRLITAAFVASALGATVLRFGDEQKEEPS